MHSFDKYLLISLYMGLFAVFFTALITLCYRQKHSLYDRSLPLVKTKIAEQREEINSIHAFVEERNTQMKQELELLLSTVRDRCSSQDSGKFGNTVLTT